MRKYLFIGMLCMGIGGHFVASADVARPVRKPLNNSPKAVAPKTFAPKALAPRTAAPKPTAAPKAVPPKLLATKPVPTKPAVAKPNVAKPTLAKPATGAKPVTKKSKAAKAAPAKPVIKKPETAKPAAVKLAEEMKDMAKNRFYSPLMDRKRKLLDPKNAKNLQNFAEQRRQNKKSSTKAHKCTKTKHIQGNLEVCNNLTVHGKIKNLELDLLRDTGVPPTDEVYTQFFQYPSAQNILENIQDFSVPRDLVIPGTEINPDAPIYGYNAETQELVLGGGPELSYNPDFEAVNLRYHGQNPAELLLTTPENMQAWYEHTLSYFLQRGYEMPGIDVYPKYEGQFIFNNQFGSGLPMGNFVGIKFYFEDSPVPIALDLVATAAPSITAIELFEANSSLRKNGFYYPMRIPITTDFAEFNQKFNKTPIVYYDNLHRRITIHVPECHKDHKKLFEYKLSIPCCNCNFDIDLQDKLVAFDGTFNLMRRNPENQLVLSGFDQLEYLIQASSIVSVKSESIDHGQSSIFTQDYNFSEPGGVFTGLAIPLMNGEGPQTDIYTCNNGLINATAFGTDPFIIPAFENDGGTLFAAGDNPVTSLVEHYGIPIYNTYYDTINWNLIELGLPLPVMEGQTTPEENPGVPLPEFFVNPNIILNNLVGHEFFHDTQALQGMIFFLPAEGQATGIEQDPKLNSSIWSGFRNARWSQYLPLVIRGDWPVTLPEVTARLLGVPTYGSSIFWRYLATQFDYNYQVVRRMGDIMSHETFGPLLEENEIPFSDAAWAFGGEIGYNPAGSLLALAQAIEELYPDKNIQDVFSDYAVSFAMLRNNTSIPEQYRHEYPYWLASPTYPGYQQLDLIDPSSATWWQDYQDNNVVSGNVVALPVGVPIGGYVSGPNVYGDLSNANRYTTADYAGQSIDQVQFGLFNLPDYRSGSKNYNLTFRVYDSNASGDMPNAILKEVDIPVADIVFESGTIETAIISLTDLNIAIDDITSPYFFIAVDFSEAYQFGPLTDAYLVGLFVTTPGTVPVNRAYTQFSDSSWFAYSEPFVWGFNGDLWINPSINGQFVNNAQNPPVPYFFEQTPFIPVLDQNVVNRKTQDMTMLIYEVPEDVNTVTVNVSEGDWRVSILQFTSDNTPTGSFIIDGPHVNNGGQTVFDISQFTGTGSIRLVAANVGIHDYEGLNNWCGAEPIMTGTISILPN